MFKTEKSKNYLILILIISSLLLSPILLNSSILNNFVYQEFANSDYSLRTSAPELNIRTPLNSTYSAPMSGYYPATYGFDDDQIGVNEPHFWNNDDDNGVESTVISEKFGHYNVLQQETGIVSGIQSLTLTGSYSSTWAALATRPITPSSDIISLEAHLMAEPFTGNNGPDPGIIKICFYNPSGNRYFTTLYLHNSGFIIFTNSTTGGVFNFGAFTPYTWYHMKIVVNITENSAKAYVNGQFMAETHLGLAASDITHIALLSGHNSVTGYVDNVIYTEGESEQVIFEDDFESYAVGTFPSSFDLIYSGTGTSYQIVTDTYFYSDSQASLWCDVGSQSYGSVEFYMGHEGFQSETANLNIMFSNGINNIFGLQMRYDGQWTYWDGNWNVVGFGSHVDSEFYHVSIRFRCSSGTPYEGLSSFYTWKTYINGNEFGEFSMNGVMDVDRLTVFTSGSSSNGFGYWDAIGVTWDPNYNIGDNLNEGLLLSFENSTILDWMGYSLDGAANITIQGNTTIQMPEDGPHTIQVSGTSPGGIDYQSDVRYFTVKKVMISIITPENSTYTEPMSGYYPGTLGFENLPNGNLLTGNGWEILEPANTDILIEDEVGGHKKVLSINDWSSSVDSWAKHKFQAPQQSGTLEWWWCAQGLSSLRPHDVRFNWGSGDSDMCFYVRLNGNEFIVNDNTPVEEVVSTIEANRWYHVKIDFECSSGGYLGLNQYTFRLYIDNNEMGIYNFIDNQNSLDNFHIYTCQISTQTNEKTYYDAIGYSWDPDYNIGDNMNEGLYLAFENSSVLDWMGYSLDGATNITIQGNTTIPMPTGNDLHSIQVSGTTTGGTTIQSDLRYFTLDWEYICLKPNLNILDLINEFGLHIQVYMNSIGFLHVNRQTFTFPGLPHVEYNQSTSYFYKIDLCNPKFLEDTSILSSMTIRFYYNPLEINDPNKLHLYHYISSTGHWRSEDITINIDQHYVEFTTTQLSYFCLSEINIPITPFPWFIIIVIIVILSTIGLSIPSGYVIISRRKKKRDKNYKTLNKKTPHIIGKPLSHVEQSYQINIIKPSISPEMIVPIKTFKVKSRLKTNKLKRTDKVDKEGPQVIDIKLSQKIIDEIKKTESEIEIKKEIDNCIIHKGQIIGLSYVCPKCFSKYCINCAQALEDRQECCWVCETPIKINQEPPKFPAQLKNAVENNLIGTYAISSENLIERFQSGGNLTTISGKFWKNLNKFDWEGNDKEEFIKEILSLTPKERQEIIDLMLKTKNKKTLPK